MSGDVHVRFCERPGVRLPRATHLVVLCQGEVERILRGIQRVLGGLGLQLNAGKTRVLDARDESFRFLGFRVMVIKHPRRGRRFCLIRPAKEALAEIRAELRSLTRRNTLALPEEMVIGQLNERIRGWVGYFSYGNGI